MSGNLIAFMAPKNSPWSLFGPSPLGNHGPKVIDGEGDYILSWQWHETNGEFSVEFLLGRVGDKSQEAVRTINMPANPTFSQFYEASTAVLDDSGPITDVFEFLTRKNEKLDTANETMNTEGAFLQDVLSQWFEPDEALSHLVNQLYVSISGDFVMVRASVPDAFKGGPN